MSEQELRPKYFISEDGEIAKHNTDKENDADYDSDDNYDSLDNFQIINKLNTLEAQVAELKRSRDGWEHDANLYAQNLGNLLSRLREAVTTIDLSGNDISGLSAVKILRTKFPEVLK
jgi:hypothetical protein